MTVRKSMRKFMDERTAELTMQAEERIYDLERKTESSSSYDEITELVLKVIKVKDALENFENHNPVENGQINPSYISYWLVYAEELENILEEE